MLEVDQLSLAYGKRTIISDLSIEGLVAGTLTALIGPNGSGKSTLLKALAGLMRATSGRISLDGKDMTRTSLETRAQKIVYLPQALPASVHLRVFESVLVAAKASALAPESGPIEVEDILSLLKRLGIEHLAMMYLDQLSGGQKQLVGLAQALIRRPRLLLLDEPLSALDLNYQFHVMDLLRQETQQHGLITLIVLHDLRIALQHCDYALMLAKGRLLAQGKTADVITPTSLSDGYGVTGRIEPCSRGTLQVMIDGLCDPIH